MNQGTLVIFNVDTTVSNDELLKLFGAHGEIREVTFCFACGFKCAKPNHLLTNSLLVKAD